MQAYDLQELNASHSPVPWTYRRGPEYWEERLQAHYTARGVNVTSSYLKYWWRAQVSLPRWLTAEEFSNTCPSQPVDYMQTLLTGQDAGRQIT